MNFDMKKLSIDEVEIDIKSLIKRCIEHFKFIIIVGIVCAILLPLVMYAKELPSIQGHNEGEQIEEVELSKEELLVIEEYILLLEKQQELEDYLENSALMDMDYKNVYKTRMQIYFEGENGYDLACAVRNYVLNGAVEYEINKNLNDHKKRVSSEMISVAIYEGSGVLNIEILAGDEKSAQKYVEIFNLQINQYCESLQNSIGNQSFKTIQLQTECVIVQSVYNLQKQYLLDYKNILSSVTGLESSLSDQQKLQIAKELGDTNFNDIKVELVQSRINFKYVILGLIIGLVVAVCLVVLVVLFSGKVQSEHEVQKRLQIAYLGLASQGKNHMIVSKINLMLLQRNIKDIIFISTTEFAKHEHVDEIMNSLKGNNISCKKIENVLFNSLAMEDFAKESNVIIVETIGKTKIKDLYQEALLCKELNANVVGYLMI